MATATLPDKATPESGSRAWPPDGLANSRMRQSRIMGTLFLAGFVVYGGGLSLVSSLVAAPDFLDTIAPLRMLLALGAFLMLLNTAVDIAKAVLFFPILERHSSAPPSPTSRP